MTEREFFEKFYKLSKDKLNTKSNKNVNVKKDAMTTVIKRCKSNKNVNVKKDAMTSVIKRCRGEKKRGIRAIDGFRKKLMIPDSEIPECPEFEAKSKIGKIFKKHNPIEEYSVKIYEIDPYFYEHYKKNTG